MTATPGLSAALVAAQAEMPAIEPDAVNPHFKSKFVSLDNLIAKTRPVLNRHGLAVVQLPATGPDGVLVLRTILIHGPTGERITADSPLILTKQDMQGLGAAITYARRYAWAAALGIAGEEDDDGNGAVAKPRVDMADRDIPFGDAPVAGVNQPPAKKATEPQKKKLDVLVAQLRDEGKHITTQHLYAAVAGTRGVHPSVLTLEIGGIDEDGVLRWRHLREALTRDEARQLIDRLELKAEQVRTDSPFQPPPGVQVELE